MARQKKDTRTRKDGLFEVKITVGKNMDGSLIRKSFYSSISKEDAKKQAAAYKVEQRAAEITGTVFAPASTAFADWARQWLVTYKKPNVDPNTYRLTYENSVEKHLIPYFGRADLKTIQPINIQNFYSTKKGLSESVLNKLSMCLKGIFDSAIENELCYKNPARSKSVSFSSDRAKNEKRVLTDAQITAVKAACALPEVQVLLGTGLRRGELLGLMWADVDTAGGTVTVQRSVADVPGSGININPPKWDSYRTVPIDQELCKLLDALPHTSLYVFPNRDGRAQSPNSFNQKLARHMAALPPDIPRLTAHELRHTYGTALRRRGVDIYTIQKVMGHKDIKMTSEIYVHNEIDELKKALWISPENAVKENNA